MDYPLTLPTPLLSASSVTNSRVATTRTAFDYRSRVRRLPPKRVMQKVGFMFTDTDLDSFATFYDSIAQTNNYQFNCDWFINGNDNVNKLLRIISTPTIKSLGAFRYNVSLDIEVIWWGTVKIYSTPLVPYNTLYPSDNLLIG